MMKANNEIPVIEEVLTAADPPIPLSEPLRLRVSEELRRELDHIEAFFRGMGYRNVSRSHLVRVAVEILVRSIYAEHPEIASHPMPGDPR